MVLALAGGHVWDEFHTPLTQCPQNKLSIQDDTEKECRVLRNIDLHQSVQKKNQANINCKRLRTLLLRRKF